MRPSGAGPLQAKLAPALGRVEGWENEGLCEGLEASIGLPGFGMDFFSTQLEELNSIVQHKVDKLLMKFTILRPSICSAWDGITRKVKVLLSLLKQELETGLSVALSTANPEA